LVIDKPSGLAVEPERWERTLACLSGDLLDLACERSDLAPAEASAPTAGLEFRPRLVHRIDKGTSGAVLVAKHIESERRLREDFEGQRIEKRYLALVEGEVALVDGETETIDAAIAPDRRRSGRMRLAPEGKQARTRVRVERRYRGFTLLACEPLTGRTHQIRVHLAGRGFPLAVDPQYGHRDKLFLSELKRGYRPKRGRPETPLIDRLTLHAAGLRFPTSTGERCEVEAPLPADWLRLEKQLAKVRPPRP
jgi:23S rRNA pseudouridine955/2504/2580 synthase